MRRSPARLLATVLLVLSATGARAQVRLFVDPVGGDDAATGAMEHPLRSLSAAVARVPDWLDQPVTIELAPGEYRDTGGVAMASNSLFLSRRMGQRGAVHIVGRAGPAGEVPVLAWEGGPCMVDVREGEWSLEGVRIGTFTKRQRRGVSATGPARITLRDVSCRLRSLSDAAVFATRGAEVALAGRIALNDDLHDAAEAESFSGIVAEDHGMVRFVGREGASLDVGNGSLSASYYGCIQLGCEWARITSWGDQSNCLAVNNSGRVDLHGTETAVCARNPRNTPVGLEDDGHVLAEGAHLVIEGQGNAAAIVLQKASSLFCNDIEIRGAVGTAVSAMSGSVCVTGFLSAVPAIDATTGAHITIEKVGGTLEREAIRASRGASVDLPDGAVVRG